MDSPQDTGWSFVQLTATSLREALDRWSNEVLETTGPLLLHSEEMLAHFVASVLLKLETGDPATLRLVFSQEIDQRNVIDLGAGEGDETTHFLLEENDDFSKALVTIYQKLKLRKDVRTDQLGRNEDGGIELWISATVVVFGGVLVWSKRD